MTEFLNGVATFNADPYCVEDEVMAQELSALANTVKQSNVHNRY